MRNEGSEDPYGSTLMADPASVRRQLDELIDQQIETFSQPTPLGRFELFEFQLRAVEIRRVEKVLEQSKPPAPWPVYKTRRLHLL